MNTLKNTLKSIACAALLVTFASPVHASKDAKTTLQYDVYAGGFKALRATLEMDMAPKAYDLELELETQGFIGRLFPWKGAYTTSGKTKKNALVPSLHTANTTWKKKSKTTEMKFNPKGEAFKTTIQTNGKTKINRDIRRSLASNAVDMLTGVVQLFQHTDSTGKCEGSFPVFDGKRRFNITLKDAGTTVIRKSRYSVFAGEALKCTLKVEPVAGFKRKDSKRGWLLIQNHTEKRKKPPTIWLARVENKGSMVPVRMEISSEYGAAVAHLTNKATP